MITALTLEEINFVSGGVEPFCPDGFSVGSISYDVNGNVTGWECVRDSDGGSWFGTAADWITWAIQAAIEAVISLF